MRNLIICIIAVFCVSCTNVNATKESLIKQGFTNIVTGNYDWFACGKDDFYATEFEATNVNGIRVKGTCCCGILKNCTIRW